MTPQRIQWARVGCFVGVLALNLLARTHANAGLMTYNITFTADNFDAANVGYGLPPAPATAVSGEFTIIFDPTMDYSTTTSGISLVSLDGLGGPSWLDSPISFEYHTGTYGSLPAHTLIIGGENFGAALVETSPVIENDFYLHITDFLGTRTFEQFGYTTAAGGYYYTPLPADVGGSTVPEPSSLALFGMGALGIFGMGRRQLRKPRPTT